MAEDNSHQSNSLGSATDRRNVLKMSAGALAAGSSIGLAGCLGDDDDETGDGYPVSEIEWTIPYSTGGGFDAYSRALAEFMPEHLPGEPEIVPENRTGAGGNIGMGHWYNADPDGGTVGIANIPGFIVSQLLEDVNYDLTEVSWFGTVAQEIYVYGVSAEDPAFESLEEMQAADQVQAGVTDVGSTASLATILSMEVMDINLDLITGYEGSAEIVTALLRGDIDVMVSHSTLATPIANDEVSPLLVVDDERPFFIDDDVPTAAELGYDDLSGTIRQQRACGGPPGIDDDVLDMLSEAMEDAIESEDMQEWSEESDRGLLHSDAETTAENITGGFELMEEFEDVFHDYL